MWSGRLFLCRRLELCELGSLLFGDNFFALCGAIECHDLAGLEFAKLTGRDIEPERSIADAADLFDMVADLFEHFSDLAIAAFGESELIPGIVTAADEVNLRRRRDDAVATAAADLVETATVDHDAAANLFEA
jgi:hypothetical protein